MLFDLLSLITAFVPATLTALTNGKFEKEEKQSIDCVLVNQENACMYEVFAPIEGVTSCEKK